MSQSYQLAPYDDYYQFNNATTYATIFDDDVTYWNTYLGGFYQQAASGLSYVDDDAYFENSGAFTVYGVEFYGNKDDRENSYITWVSSGVKSWTLLAGAIGANSKTEIGPRLISEEPMAMVLNFGMSNNFESVDFEGLTFPNHMYIEYVVSVESLHRK